ncbi:copper resistance protein B [Aliidiomarina quisquiliarum]|uniref:copper resistance protein B n=1 Tax=Aliidiomarina quisquiliarum TaxID=2938947 RepID=UPI00208EA043|nr:copper resistance protein B [Aliidiomarina quisquiliarum]MCO4321401.1 copper resistance protein B [Aliidiomarina quisquiliarum]
MKNINLKGFKLSLIAALLMSGATQAGGGDDPLLTKVMLDEVERGLDSNDPTSFKLQAWVGKDLNKLWLKSRGDYQNSDDKELEIQALYSRAIAPYWDAQMGIRVDLEPSPSRNWAVLGIQGLAPYFFEIDAALFIGEEGRTAMRVTAEYEMLLTQKLILSPEVKMNLYGKNDAVLGIGSGLSDISAGLRLRYEIKREFAPYIGVEWARKFGNTAEFARNEGKKVEGTQVVIGLKAWF